MARLVTDSPQAARLLLTAAAGAELTPHDRSVGPGAVLDAFFDDCTPLYAASLPHQDWSLLLVRDYAPRSQFDDMIALVRAGADVPDGLAVLARHGAGFHGARGHAWAAAPGNIHLTVHFAPQRPVPGFDAIFTALGAVSCIDAIGAVAGLGRPARIKWVNDVIVDGRKLGGVLAFTQVQGAHVSAVAIGIGLNVVAVPAVARSADVPDVGALAMFTTPAPAVAAVADALLAALQHNYGILLDEGCTPILERYRAASAVIGEHVIVRDAGSARIIAAGRVTRIGDGLELYLDERAPPVRAGRLVFAPGARSA